MGRHRDHLIRVHRRRTNHLTADLDTIMNGRTGDHVAVMLGTNDALGRTSLPTVAQLNTLTDRIIATGAASVRWITIPPLR
ncbi:MAG: hypothetical protein IPN02_07990 [Candidatus Microthrix sp.]|uniref:Uncharacterized protein n=1 Tax=Candidatus Neomicrothrix subdominans TaxID=2954438 RepID=A0A936NB78_9ACTN|nr:hypothetical protein [Candidatus Microthrix subdominans]